MTDFRYLSAADWGMTWARPPVNEVRPDPEVFVHHTAGRHPDDAVQAFRELNEQAIRVDGYSAIDYDILIHRNPYSGLITIGEGRGPYMSAATRDRNEQGEAVCLLGYFHPGHSLSRHPHSDEVEGVARGIVYGVRNGWIRETPLAKIMGHRDNPAHPGATACPGNYLYTHLPFIRNRVNQLLVPVTQPDPVPEISAMITVQEIDALGAVPSPAQAKESPRWFNALLLKCGAVMDVQRQNNIPVTGNYDTATANAYASLIR